MAIAFVNTATASSGSVVASLALPATSLTTGNDIIVDVCLLDTTKTVSSITDTAGNTYTKLASINGTGVRIEKWGKHSATGNAANVVTVNFSGNTAAAVESSQYSGSTGFGNTGTATGASAGPGSNATTQDANSWVQVGAAIAGTSTDTISSGTIGTKRGSKVDGSAGTIPEIASADNTNGSGLAEVPSNVLLNVTTDNWASAAVELRTGSTGSNYLDYTGELPLVSPPLNKEERFITMREPLAFSSAATPTPTSGQLWPI